jgi:hypothetical protein
LTETRTTLKVSKTDPEINEEVTFTASVDEIVYDAALHTCIWKPLTTPAPTLTIYTYGMVLERDPITHRPIARWKRIEVCSQQTNTGTIMCTKSWTSPSVTGPQTYHAEFAGDNTHAKSTSCGISLTVHTIIPTTLTYSMRTTYPIESPECSGLPFPWNQLIVFSGDLKAPDGSGIPGKVVTITDAIGNPVIYDGQPVTATTDADGHYATGDDCITGVGAAFVSSVPAKAHFAGDREYAESWSAP